MAQKSSEYWEKRIAASTWKTYNSLEERNRDLLDFYIDASEQVKKELYSIAEKYSKNGVLSLSEMHKQNRLTALNKKLESIIEDLGHKTEESAKKNMQDGFRTVYKDTAVAMGDEDFSMPNRKLMEKLLQEPWRGDSFSGRLWKNQKKLAVGLNDLLLSGLQQGKTATEIAVSLHNFMGQGFNECHRLVRTETMHYLNSATQQRYKDAGVKYVQIWAAEDERTCDECSKYHGKIYPIDKCPHVPFHPNCRCTIIPVTDESMIEDYEKSNKESRSDIDDYLSARRKYQETELELAELEKEADALMDKYMDAMGTPSEKEANDRFEAKYDQVESIREILKDLKAKLSGKEAKAVRHLEKSLASKSGIPIEKIKLTGLPYDSAENIYKAYDVVLKKYPELKGNLAGLKFKDKAGRAMAGCDTKSGEINVYSVFSDYAKMKRVYNSDVKNNFHPAGTDERSIVVHELGHALDGWMSKQGIKGGSTYRGTLATTSSSQIRREVLQKLGYDGKARKDELKKQGYTHSQIFDKIREEERDLIVKEVSQYASGYFPDGTRATATPEREFFAECFSEYVMSKKPRRAAKYFGEILDKSLGR